jgi:hypothetical protein
MVKIVRLLFDLLFAQIVAPLVVASDLNGSGRAKQVVQNLISCNIVMIAVIFILRLYIYVLISAQDKNYPFTVLIALTVGGAMFVIDGPDLIVKILGVDAGVKSGAAAIMSIRSATQIAGSTVSNTSRAVGNVVKKGNTAAAAVAGGLSGQMHGAINGAKSGFEHGISKHTDGNGNFNSVGGKIATYGGAFGSMLKDGVTGGFTGLGKGYLAGESEARNSQGAVSTAVHGINGVKSGWDAGKTSNTSSNTSSTSTSNIGTTNTSSGSSIVTTPKTDSGNSSFAESAKGDKGEMGINGVNGHNGNDGKNGIDGLNGQNNVNTTSNNTANIGNAFNKPTNNIANEPTNQQVYNDLNK